MSGLDPLAAALAAQAAAGAQAAMDEAVLSIGADIAVLQAQINVGDVIAATVLPPQGGTDLLSFLGQTVPAQLPAGVNPGESLLLQVTSFTNTAVIVRNLGVVDPQNPVPTVNVELPPQTPDAPQTAVLTTTVSLPQQSAPPPPPSVPAAQTPPPSAQPAPPSAPPPPANVAPPRSVFVAAAVRAAAPGPVPPEAIERANAAVQTSAASSDVEARIAVLRAGGSPPPQTAAPASTTQPAQSAPLPPPTAAGRLPVAPPIVLDGSPRAAAAQAQAQNQTAPAQAREPETPQAALLARLRVPVTPVTLAAARVMQNATSTLTSAYEKLDALLARMAPAQIPPSLRSSLGFVARMDLQSSALPEQIAAFVSDVLDGAEAKLAQAIQAWLPVTAPERETVVLPEPPGLPPAQQQQTTAPSSPAPALQTAQPQQQAAPAEPNAAAVTNAAAQASERTIALEYDPKTAILSMLQEQSAPSTASASPAPIVAALRDALVATTAVQLGTLSSQINNPSAIVLSLPAYYYEGGAPVQLRISRDASESKKKMDADNFHIAFVLDTQSLGTVAIDVQTVGRAVSVDVKTQASLAADRFRSSFGDLRSRLERLRYRIANINAGVAAAAGAAQAARAPEPANEPPPSRRAFWDTRA